MNLRRWGFLAVLVLIVGPLAVAARISASYPYKAVNPQPTPTGPIATADEVAAAHAIWAQSAHADTYDDGMGANSTCASCKSPLNWDPTQDLAQQQALQCSSCKRVPGAPRPALESGVPVPVEEWQNITCEICHVPAGDSYYTGIAYWNKRLRQYEAVDSVAELCAKCHEGRHGFHVIDEQEASRVHAHWDCTDCHGSHGEPSSCRDCHDSQAVSGSAEHARHPSVNCTACHDGGGLSVWLESDLESAHYGEYITVRFAHALTSWPSHNLTTDIDCQRCHHPLEDRGTTLVPYVGCDACHTHSYGAVSEWCEFFRRDVDPNAVGIDEP